MGVFMAYLVTKKVAGKKYFYLARYVGKQQYRSCKYEYLYTFGNEKIALERFTLWLIDKKFMPVELLEMGVSFEDIKKWKSKISGIVRKVS